MNMRVFCLIAATLPALISCTSQQDIDTLTMRMNKNEQQIKTLSSQVGNVEQVLPGQAEMWAQVQSMRQELNILRGQIDELNAKTGSETLSDMGKTRTATERLEVALRQMAAELGMNIEALNTPSDSGDYASTQPGRQSTLAPTSSTISATTGATPPVTAQPQGADMATTLYNAGMDSFGKRNYKDAIKAFTDFTKTYPSHKLTGNAHFWRGESYFQLKDYATAALAYQEVYTKFPGNAKMQSAMLKQGMAFYHAGKKDAMKARFDELAKKYPNSPETARAKQFMQANK